MDRKPHAPPASDPSVKEIIAAARARQQPVVWRAPAAPAWLLSSVTAVLLWASFTPVDAGPLAWIALVPLLVLVRIPQPTRWMYRILFLNGLANQIATLQWMRLGDPTMYIAMAALATYLACYFPLFVALARYAHHRWSVPLVVVVPVLWTGLEFVRAHFLTGFSWYYLGHSQYRWLELIQISDVVGAYGVSFLVAMGNAAIAGLIPSRWLLKPRLITPEAALLQAAVPFRSALVPVLVTLVGFAAVLGYGIVRRQQSDFQPGPRVALIQGNFVASLREHHDPQEMLIGHLRLTGLAVREQPDLVVWPEAMFPYPLLEAASGMTDEQLVKMTPGTDPDPKIWREAYVQRELARESQRAGAALLLGIHAARAEADGIRQLNSAVFVTPEQGLVGRYDKRHLVPFGEFIPFKGAMPWIQGMTPYSGEDIGLTAGTVPKTFEYKGWRFAPVICYEDTVPHVVRSAVARAAEANGPTLVGVGSSGEEAFRGAKGDAGRGAKGDTGDGAVDVLVNLSNDGWFHGSSELDQHLITAAFRAVECRTPMIRAVNTGISAVIDGDGAILEPEKFIDGDWRQGSPKSSRTSMRDPKTGRWHRQLNAALVHTVPLDNRRSAYVVFGDWFAGACAACVGLTAALSCVRRRKVLGPAGSAHSPGAEN
jgi:apolipoprotein N-acyltransferase